jgi:hypothetical protein
MCVSMYLLVSPCTTMYRPAVSPFDVRRVAELFQLLVEFVGEGEGDVVGGEETLTLGRVGCDETRRPDRGLGGGG